MRSHVAIVVLATSFMLSLTTNIQAQQRIRWYTNFSQAVKAAQRSNQLILLHFEMDNCRPCREVERNVFPRPQVAQAVGANFIPVKLNYKNAKKLAAQLKVNLFPTDVIFTPQGKVLHQASSPRDAQRYTQILNRVATGYYGQRQMDRTRIAGRSSRSNYAGDVRGRTNPSGRNSQRPNGVVDNRSFNRQDNRRGNVANNGGSQRNSQFVGQRDNRNSAFANQRSNNNRNSEFARNNQFNGGRRSNTTNSFDNTRRSSTNDNRFARGGAFDPQRSNQKLDSVGPPRAGSGFRNAPYGSPSVDPGRAQRQNPTFDPQRNRRGQDQRQRQPRDNRFVNNPSQTTGSQANQRNGFDPRRGRANDPAQRRNPKFVNNPYTGNGATGRNGAGGRNDAGRSGSRGLNSPNPVCFDGYCPVTLAKDKLWRKGDQTQSMTYQGRTYYFANSAARRLFAQQPDRFTPVFSGYDPVIYLDTGQRVLGQRRHGLFVGGTIYLFRDEISLRRFKQSPKKYTNGLQQAQTRAQQRRRY